MPRCGDDSFLCNEELDDQFRCWKHGQCCRACSGVGGWGDDSLCSRCRARQNGVCCGSCGAPWPYIYSVDDECWYCNPCMYSAASKKGYYQEQEEIDQMLQAVEDARHPKSDPVDAAKKEEPKPQKRRGPKTKEEKAEFEKQNPRLMA